MALTKITTSVIAANTLATGNIADNSVDATKIASNSILTRHIDDDQITGDQLADDITIAGNLTVTGNLTTNGSSVTNSSTNTTIEDALIELGTGTSGSPSNDSGIIIERGSSDNVFIGFDESADKVMVATTSATGASTGNLTLTAAPLVTGALTASGLAYPTSDGSSGQFIKTDGSGTLSFANSSSSTSVSNYTATGDGSTTAFDTGTNPANEINTWVFVDGVYQQKSVYSYSGSTITFATAPESGAKIDVVTGITDGIQDSETVLGVFEATTTATDTYATSLNAAHENNTWVFVGGVYQPKDSYTFSTSGSLVFDANTPAGEKLAVVTTKALTASAVTTDSIAASAVTTAKIADNAITSAKIPNNSIVGADISATTSITANTFTGALTGNVTGNVTGNLTGTIQTAAQTNITSVGTLTSFRSTGIDDNADALAITIDSNERVGIGISSNINSNLHVGSSAATGDATNPAIQIGGTTTYRGGLYTTSEGFVLDNANGDDGIQLHTKTAGEAVRITSDGNLEFKAKTTSFVSPGFTYHTNNYLYLRGGSAGLVLADDSSINTVQIVDGSSGYINFETGDGTSRMRINSSGNVGIGTTSPTSALHVTSTTANTNGMVRFQNNMDNNYETLRIESLGDYDAHIGFFADGSSNYYWGAGVDYSDSGKFKIANDNLLATNTRLTIDTSGNVGIGASSALDNKLEVNGGDIRVRGTSTPTLKLNNGDQEVVGMRLQSGATGNLSFHTDKMVINSSGLVGIGTDSPAQAVEIYRNSSSSSSGSYSALSLRNDHSSGYMVLHFNEGTSQVWDLLVQNGVDALQFRRTGSEVARFTDTGQLLIGRTTALQSDNKLSVEGSGTGAGNAIMDIRNTASSDTCGCIALSKASTTTDSSARFIWFFANNFSTSMGAIGGNGASNVQFVTASDERLKENIQPITGALDKVLALNPVSFTWKENGEHIKAGFVAQEVEKVLPEYTDTEEDEMKTKSLTGGMTAGYISVLTKAIQEQQEQIETLKAEVKELKEG